MRFAFVGAVKGSLVALEALLADGLVPALTVALSPAAAARHSDYADLSPVAATAGGAVLAARDINADAVVEALRDAAVDVALVIGWSQICRAPFRAAPRLGAVGYHPAALPRMRGRAVIPWTILSGARETASTLFWLDEGVDSGPILAQEAFAVAADETATTLYAKHNRALAAMLPGVVRALSAGAVPGRVQDEAAATWCARRIPEDGLIDWRQGTDEVLRLVRAVADPYPNAYTFDRGERIEIGRAEPNPEPWRFLGLPGQVQRVGDSDFTVRCGDGGCIDVLAWRGARNAPPPLHGRLGGAVG